MVKSEMTEKSWNFQLCFASEQFQRLGFDRGCSRSWMYRDFKTFMDVLEVDQDDNDFTYLTNFSSDGVETMEYDFGSFR